MQFGFIAQDLQSVLPEVFSTPAIGKKDLSDRGQSKSEIEETYGVYYNEIIPVLVKAIQDQQEQLQEKEQRIAQLEARLDRLDSLFAQNDKDISATEVNLYGKEQPQLEQNAPNPFSGETQVKYYLPKNVERAQLCITDKSGKKIKNIELQGPGTGQVNINTNDLLGGTYQYSLLIDGRLVVTRQMILIK